MAKLAAVRIGKTFNKGNFESHRVDVELNPEPGDSIDDVIEDANALVEYVAKGGCTSCDEKKAERILDSRKRVSRYR